MNSPVLVIALNRPDLLSLLFDKIKAARPRVVYMAVDGREIAATVREKRLRRFDCRRPSMISAQTRISFLKENFGCKNGFAAAIIWFFGRK